jgi:hypothetical protein
MNLKRFNDFIFEFGTGYEGGPAGRDVSKVKDRMFTDIDLEDDGEEKEEEDIPILQDLLEQATIDPYGEENWNEKSPEFKYTTWKGSLYDFLVQLNDEYINETLQQIERCITRKEARLLVKDVLIGLEDKLDPIEYRAVERDIEILEELVEEPNDEGPDPDEAYDRLKDRMIYDY